MVWSVSTPDQSTHEFVDLLRPPLRMKSLRTLNLLIWHCRILWFPVTWTKNLITISKCNRYLSAKIERMRATIDAHTSVEQANCLVEAYLIEAKRLDLLNGRGKHTFDGVHLKFLFLLLFLFFMNFSDYLCFDSK